MKIKTISILGPTASGKTSLAIALAKLVDGEVVSSDSMQLYRGMDIGTATPTLDEQDGVRHHLFDIVDPRDSFSAAEYAKYATAAIEDIASRGKTPIICGGTGLYYDSLMKITEFSETVQDDELRDRLYEFAREHGNEALHARLRDIDPESAEAIHPNNVKRVIRAIEIYETTGRPKSEIDCEQTSGETRYDDRLYVIEYNDRDTLYSRIDRRVDIMVDEGLEEEVRRLYAGEVGLTAAQAIGYKEFLPYFKGEKTIDEVKADIKLSTRHYAKRQMIWMRRYKDAYRIIPDKTGEIECADELALEIYNDYTAHSEK